MLVMDGFHKPAWGLEQVDGKRGHENATSRPGRRLIIGRPHTVVLTVTRAGIAASCDGTEVVRWSGDSSRLALEPGWTMPGREDCLVLGAQAPFRITRLRLEPLGSDPGHFHRGPVADNTLTEAEARDGWTLLFDGRTTDGWRCYVNRAPAEEGWSASDGWLTMTRARARSGERNLMSTRSFAKFDLRFDWRIGFHGNSGVVYRPLPPAPGGSPIRGCEYQILDDSSYPSLPSTSLTGALWGVLGPQSKTRYLSGGQVNRSRVVARGNHVEHWLNGSLVLAYDADSAEFRGRVAASQFRDATAYGRPAKRPILIQGEEAWFRNLKIRELSPEM
jgi:hypothetical protein